MATKQEEEPLFSDIDTTGFPGMTPVRRKNEFAITAEGFIPLAEKQYCFLPFQFRNTVPESAWVYYCIMFFYARLVTLKKEEGYATHDEESFANQVLSGKHPLPKLIEAYIQGLGNVTDKSSVLYKLRMPAWPNADGHFGRVASNTHWKYMSMPCPLICAVRIQQDLGVTPQYPHMIDEQWNLPTELQPVDAEAGNPTRNCLGWAVATSLTPNQLVFIESTDVTADVFPTTFKQFYYSQDLFEKVSLDLSKIGEKIFIAPQTPKSPEGSLAQMCWIEVEPVNLADCDMFSSYLFYAENAGQYGRRTNVVSSFCFDNVLEPLVFTYRVRKDEFGSKRPYCIYDFGEYQHVPYTWHETRNTIFEYGCCDRWNVMLYTSAYLSKCQYRNAWLKQSVK